MMTARTFRLIRRATKLSQAEMGVVLGVDKTTIRRWELGITKNPERQDPNKPVPGPVETVVRWLTHGEPPFLVGKRLGKFMPEILYERRCPNCRGRID